MTDISASSTQSVPVVSDEKPLSAPRSRVSLSTVNRILTLVAVAVLIYFVLTLFAGFVKLMGTGRHIHELEMKGAKAATASDAPKKYVKAELADPALGNRNIFQPSSAIVSAPSDASGNLGSTPYRLVGISKAKDPAETYVMLENTQNKITYFLQYSQPVEGLQLEKILEDKVIVKIGGKSVEFE